jgi:hypothetical protein
MASFAIQGHDEQMKNEKVLNQRYPNEVDTNNGNLPLGEYINNYVRKRHGAADMKYKNKTMESMNTAIKEASYVEAANELLFGRGTERNGKIEKIEKAEREMDTPEIRANRKYIKVMFQACEGICEGISEAIVKAEESSKVGKEESGKVGKEESGKVDTEESIKVDMAEIGFNVRVTKKEDSQKFSIDELKGKISSTAGIVEIITQENSKEQDGQVYSPETMKQIGAAKKASNDRKENMKGKEFGEDTFTMLKESREFLDEISKSKASAKDLKADLKIFRAWQEAKKDVDMTIELEKLKTDVFQRMVKFQIAIGKETTTGF